MMMRSLKVRFIRILRMVGGVILLESLH